MLTSRRRVRLVAAFVVLAGLLGALPAAAATHYFCYTYDYYGDRGFYFTPIMTTSEEIDERSTGFEFSRFTDAQGLPTEAGSIGTGCSSSSNLDAVRKWHQDYPNQYPGLQLVDWPDPPVPSVPAEPSMPTDALLIEEAPPAGPSPEVLAAWRESDRRAAAENARKLAASLRADAELQARYEESRRKYRRQAGSQ